MEPVTDGGATLAPGSEAGSAALVRAVLARPRLWPTALRQGARMARPGWWRRAPFLPLPDPDYLAFRLETQYGGTGTDGADPLDLVHYLEWCRAEERRRRV